MHECPHAQSPPLLLPRTATGLGSAECAPPTFTHNLPLYLPLPLSRIAVGGGMLVDSAQTRVAQILQAKQCADLFASKSDKLR